MNREAIYEAWVLRTGAWSLWARPVLFGQMTETSGAADPTQIRLAWDLFGETPETAGEQPWLNLSIDWSPPPEQNAALILDLRGAEGVHLGLALAGRGYRPVPLYNGCTGPSELIDQGPILERPAGWGRLPRHTYPAQQRPARVSAGLAPAELTADPAAGHAR